MSVNPVRNSNNVLNPAGIIIESNPVAEQGGIISNGVSVVSVRNLSFQYNSEEVLADVSFEIGKGDYVGLVGPNGSGKTTLIRNLFGLLRPSAGTVSLFGRSLVEFHEWHKVGYLSQKFMASYHHFPATVKEVVSMGLLSTKRFPKRMGSPDDAAVEKALARMDILDLKSRLIYELSGGQQQRVFIARTIVNEPELLILDEPTAAIDPETRERFFNILRDLHHQNQTTIILVTHDIGSVGTYASKMMYVDKRVIFYGTFEAFCQSVEMTSLFGSLSQHLICHRHG
ncbi:MAG: metal ABC transporter ATP-binding protein [Deltaproteobacteria bacterium]|nr:metal ABC transporter ATP-binding protein [Deltaproteobacteria bacterium]MBM4322363.1 metal ABC transporter ATP-binding protein [Deltaproteobacteria bacterium]